MAFLKSALHPSVCPSIAPSISQGDSCRKRLRLSIIPQGGRERKKCHDITSLVDTALIFWHVAPSHFVPCSPLPLFTFLCIHLHSRSLPRSLLGSLTPLSPTNEAGSLSCSPSAESFSFVMPSGGPAGDVALHCGAQYIAPLAQTYRHAHTHTRAEVNTHAHSYRSFEACHQVGRRAEPAKKEEKKSLVSPNLIMVDFS